MCTLFVWTYGVTFALNLVTGSFISFCWEQATVTYLSLVLESIFHYFYLFQLSSVSKQWHMIHFSVTNLCLSQINGCGIRFTNCKFVRYVYFSFQLNIDLSVSFVDYILSFLSFRPQHSFLAFIAIPFNLPIFSLNFRIILGSVNENFLFHSSNLANNFFNQSFIKLKI